MKRLMAAVVVWSLGAWCMAAAPPTTSAGGSGSVRLHEAHPTVPGNTAWVRPVVVGIAAVFAAAIPIGLLVRVNRAEEPSRPADHDDSHPSPGGGHHH